jgi:nucleoside 2-deoxyribosyltransferase
MKIYLAGPITGLDYTGAVDWRVSMIEDLKRVGIEGLSPMRAKEYLAGETNITAQCDGYEKFGSMSIPRGIMTRDRWDATRCDLLLVNFLGATRVSIGTCMEIAWADLKRIPIICAMEKTGNPHDHAMITEAIGFRVDSLDEAFRVACASLNVGLPVPVRSFVKSIELGVQMRDPKDTLSAFEVLGKHFGLVQ